MSNRSYEENVDYWSDGQEPAEISPMLPHLTNQYIRGLGDSYDDARIDLLICSYLELRNALLEVSKLIR